jgi:lipoprotein-releasing system permease protein
MLFLAIRHLLSQRKQTTLILLGISLGTMVYVSIAGIQFGFREFIIETLIDSDAHVKITGREEIISAQELDPYFGKPGEYTRWVVAPSGRRDEARILYPQGWFSRLENLPGVVAYAPQFQVQAILHRGNVKYATNLIGIHTEKQLEVTDLAKNMREGRLQSIGRSGNRIVLGSGLATKLGARKDETVLVSSGADAVPFKIAGIYHSGIQQLDDVIAYAAILDVQQVAKTPGRVTTIAVRLDDVDRATEISDELKVASLDKVQSWSEANSSLLEMFKVQDFVRIFITVTVMLVAAFGIYNVLTIIINQKKREIAILRALGFSPSEVERLFLSQGAILGILGSTIGLILGFLLCFGLGQMKFNVPGFEKFLISYDLSIYAWGMGMATVSSVVAGFLPARAAKKMTPIDIIRAGS